MARVLIADDTEVAITVIRRALEGAGHHVTATSDGYQALKEAQENDFDSYVIDVRMPRLDGFTLCSSIKKKYPHRPVVLVTALPVEKYQSMAEASGASLLISKPFDAPEFMSQMEKFLG